jgi:hypothetical protein
MNPAAQESPVEQVQHAPEPENQGEQLLNEILQNNSLAQEHEQFEYAIRIGQAAFDAQAGLAMNTPQAAMKIMAGRELGVSSIVALHSIFVIKNRIAYSGGLIAALLHKSGFTWSFVQHNEDGCVLAVFRNGKPMMDRWLDDEGQWRERQVRLSFTRADADRARLTEKQGEKKDQPSMYDKYPLDMTFNRCITRLQRRYAPEVSHGIQMYTPDEMEEITDAKPAPHAPLMVPQRVAQSAPKQPVAPAGKAS